MRTLKLFFGALLFAVVAAISGRAQTAQLTSDQVALAPEGGSVRLLATLTYMEKPAAIGWEVALPDGWSFEKVAGGTPPQISAARGSNGTLEFAFTDVPEGAANFEITVRYPAGSSSVTITSVAYLRVRGEQTSIRPQSVRIPAIK